MVIAFYFALAFAKICWICFSTISFLPIVTPSNIKVWYEKTFKIFSRWNLKNTNAETTLFFKKWLLDYHKTKNGLYHSLNLQMRSPLVEITVRIAGVLKTLSNIYNEAFLGR